MSRVLYEIRARGYHLLTTGSQAVTRRSGSYYGLDYLLDLDGEIFPLDDGHWARIQVQSIRQDRRRPHGIKYSLTLHDSSNHRVLGYDNAHAFKPSGHGFGKMRESWDHVHQAGRVKPYRFSSPARLLVDFWKDVNEYLGVEL